MFQYFGGFESIVIVHREKILVYFRQFEARSTESSNPISASPLSLSSFSFLSDQLDKHILLLFFPIEFLWMLAYMIFIWLLLVCHKPNTFIDNFYYSSEEP